MAFSTRTTTDDAGEGEEEEDGVAKDDIIFTILTFLSLYLQISSVLILGFRILALPDCYFIGNFGESFPNKKVSISFPWVLSVFFLFFSAVYNFRCFAFRTLFF